MHELVELCGRALSSLSMGERARVKHFSFSEGALWYNSDGGLGRAPRLCIPQVPGNSLRLLVMFEAHDGLLHQSIEKSFVRLSKAYYWGGMRGSMERYVNTCKSCKLMKSRNTKQEGFKAGHSVPAERWEVIAMDFILGLQETKDGFDAISVIFYY